MFVPVALLVAAVEGEGVEEDDGGVVRVLPLIRHRLQVLHQLHHLVVVLHQVGGKDQTPIPKMSSLLVFLFGVVQQFCTGRF